MKISILKQIPLLTDVDENILSELIKEREIYEGKYKKNTTVQ